MSRLWWGGRPRPRPTPRSGPPPDACRRREFLLVAAAALSAPALCAAEESPVADVIAEMASDLSQADASAFLAHFDRIMPGYNRLAEYARALSDQADVGSSVSITKETGDDLRRQVELDWVLQVSGKQTASRVENREQNVRCTFERRKKRWLVTAFAPIEFLAPPSGR